jgi:alpha-mannosidase
MTGRLVKRVSFPPAVAIALGLVCAVTPFAQAQTGAARVALPSPWLSGYSRTVAGQELEYHSPLPDAQRALLVRSDDSAPAMEWETAVVPADFREETATFVMLAGIDATDDTREFVLSIDGGPALRFETPLVAETGTLTWAGDGGVWAEFRVVLVDRYADAMGYLLLHVPHGMLKPGAPLRLSVTGESAGSRTWFMVFKSEITPGIQVRGNPAIVRTPNGPKQTVRVDALYLGEASLLRMEAPGVVSEALLDFGLTRLELEVPAVESPMAVALAFELDDDRYETELHIEPVPALDLYLIHHTHLDIGYTHVQDEVERLQWAHLEEALALGEASDTFPEEAGFVWHPEGVWAIESYLATRPAARREALLEGIRRGWIHVDGLYANLLTGLATGEALFRTLQPARDVTAEAGVPLRSAMFSDIPGMSWGVVPALAQAGVRYLSLGPNRGHRIGSFLDTWADRPFWWESPSGKERVLTWVHGGGYSIFHTGLGYEHLETRLDEELILAYADTLAARSWAHGIAGVRYNIGSDNGPPDSTLSATVAAWNERHVTPRLVVASVTELFTELEARAGDVLPVVRGDLTGYWEDGAASSARETAMARRAAESLVQTEALAAMTGSSLPRADLEAAWREVLLFLEHTWGSWNSVSEPEAEFTISQWQRKREFAEVAVIQSDRLRARALGPGLPGEAADSQAATIDVLNSTQWERSDVVVFPAAESAAIAGLRDSDETAVESQRLEDGSLAFSAHGIPPWSGRRFRIMGAAEASPVSGPATDASTSRAGTTLDNGLVRLVLDPVSGGISSMQRRADGRELVPSGEAIDEYLYVPGRDPAAVQSGGPARVRITDSGPLVWTAVIAREAPGTESGLETRIRLFAGSERVEITHRFDKTMTYDPEAVLLRIPVALEAGETVVGGPWGAWRANLDQAPGANHNYATIERWADLHDDRGGLQFISVDIPGIQLGSLGTDATVAGWRESTDPAPVLYSYVMNNYWETNYRAGQDGPHELVYTLRPHGGFDAAEAERFALQVAHPLVVRAAEAGSAGVEPPLRVSAERTIVSLLRTHEEGPGLLLRLYNPSDQPDEVRIAGSRGASTPAVLRTDPWGDALEAGGDQSGDPAAGPIVLAPGEVATFLVQP